LSREKDNAGPLFPFAGHGAKRAGDKGAVLVSEQLAALPDGRAFIIGVAAVHRCPVTGDGKNGTLF